MAVSEVFGVLGIDVSPIRDSKGASLQVELHCATAELAMADADVGYSGQVDVSAEVTNTGFGMVVRGWVSVIVTSPCSRCLEPAGLPLRIALFEEYRDGTAQGDTDLPGADVESDFRAYSGGTVDLTDAVRDAIIVATPIRILCRDDCIGLCPMCGANLATHPCDCSPPGDLRFEALAKLLRP